MGFVEENSVRKDKKHINTLKNNQVAVFPQGYIHFEVNNGCDDAFFISALDHEDPGTISISLRGFELPDDILENAYNLSKEEIVKIRENLPSNPTLGTAECRKRCKNKIISSTTKKTGVKSSRSSQVIEMSIHFAFRLVLLKITMLNFF